MHANVRLLPPGQLLGSTRRSQSVPGAVLAETAYAPNLELPPHNHSSMTLFLIVRGHYEEIAEGSRFSYAPGSFAYNPPYGVHSGRFAEQRSRALHVELTRTVERSAFPMDRSRLGASTEQTIGVLLRHLHAELNHDDAVQPLAIEGLALQVTAALARADTADSQTREQSAVRRVREMLSEASHALPDWEVLSAEVGVSPSVLLRAFRRAVGCSPATYVRRFRVTAAAQRLERSDATLSRIALDAGFYDQAHFCRAFKAAFGVTPSAYRRLHRS